MAIGLPTRKGRAVSLEEGAAPGAARCPACEEPLFVWLEANMNRVAPGGAPSHNGPREDEIVDRCENCGLVVPRGDVPSPDEATEQLLASAGRHGDELAIRVQNAASLQAWLGAENWAALAPGGHSFKPTPRAAALLLARRGLSLRRVRHLARPGMASMWQTLLNLLTFHRDFAAEAVSGRLRPGTGRGLAAFSIDVLVTILAAVPTAILAVLLEGGAVIARRGGVVELRAEQLPPTS